MINVLHVSYSKSGGAGAVAAQLSRGQALLANYESDFLFASESNIKNRPFDNMDLTTKAVIDNLIIKKRSWPTLFTLTRNTSDELLSEKLVDFEGVLHFHWLNGILNLHNVVNYSKMGKKILWTIHDMEPFTGGCHNSINCMNFEKLCSGCPAVKQIFMPQVQKAKLEKNGLLSLIDNVTLVFPSRWLLNNFKSGAPQCSSALEFVPNPVSDIFFEKGAHDLNFKKRDSQHLVLGFVSNDLNDSIKRFAGVIEAVQMVSKLVTKPIKLIAVGAKFKNYPKELNFEVIQAGVVSDQSRLRDLYSEMDLLISNSLSESFGLTIAEASAVGVPSLVLEGSGSSELIENNLTGFIYKNQVELISKIVKISESETVIRDAGLNAKENAIKNWKMDRVLNRYDKLYDNLL
jgi:glycosyltransferase involved in cell wall biosynthesis